MIFPMKRPTANFSLATITALALVALLGSISSAETSPRNRITRKIETRSTIALKGNVHPLARAAYDRGKVSPSFRMERVTMMFKPSDAQTAALQTLLEEQQDPASPNYHRWLTPEEFGNRFGLSSSDLSQIVSWIRNQGFTVNEVARSRQWVTFTGSAGRIESVFRTPIHEYKVNGEMFYANASDPYIPKAVAGLVLGFRSLNNFRLQPRANRRHVNDALSSQFTSSTTGNHFISPDDLGTIYDLKDLYDAHLDGSGQTIAVAGQTDIQLSDIQTFRSLSGLPPNDPKVILVPGSSDPGTNNNDLGEADLDLEWSGAVARNAHIIYVNSNNGAFDSFQYAIDQNLAPILSISYGSCEQNFTVQDMRALEALGQEANVQGITILAATGDTGAADCDSTMSQLATKGLAVDAPSSLPYVTGLGGSEFQETTDSWNPSNSTTFGSALFYIPEIAWNDSSLTNVLTAGGGGHSLYFAKPTWQTGAGVPNDQARDVPDLSLHASDNHDGYLICSLGSCVSGFRASDGTLTVVGGTSIGAPAFAGIVAIINQQTNSAQGNINPMLYRLANSTPSAFHDITSGGNQVPCLAGSTDCANGGFIGYPAGPGYDQATGLGSIDAYNLVAAWAAAVGSSIQSPPPVPGTPQPGATGSVPQPIAGVEEGSVRSGYAVISPDAGSSVPSATVTFATVHNGIVESQAGLIATARTTSASLFVNMVPGIGRDIGIAIASPGNGTNTITLTLQDDSGTTVATTTLSVASDQQIARYVSELFSNVVGNAFSGSVHLHSQNAFSLLALSFSGTEFSALPLIGTTDATGVPPISLAGGDSAGGTGAVMFPQFAIGGGWATEIAFINNSPTDITGRIDVFDTSGNPMPVQLNSASQSTFRYFIPAGGTFVLAPRDANGQSPL